MAFGAAGLTTGQHRLPEVAFAAGQACFVHVFQHFDRDIAANAGTVPEVLGGEAVSYTHLTLPTTPYV